MLSDEIPAFAVGIFFCKLDYNFINKNNVIMKKTLLFLALAFLFYSCDDENNTYDEPEETFPWHQSEDLLNGFTTVLEKDSLEINDVYFVNQNVGYAVGVIMYGDSYYDDGGRAMLYKTIDGGVSWFLQIRLYDRSKFDCVVFKNEDIGYFAGGGVYKTTDGGNSWFFLTESGLTNNRPRRMELVDDMIVVYQLNNNVLISSDDGASWQEINFYNQLDNDYRIKTTKVISKNEVLLAGYYSSNHGLKEFVAKSNDLASTWDISVLEGDFIWANAFKFYQSDDEITLFSNFKFYKSIDNGGSWNLSKLDIDYAEVEKQYQTNYDQIFATFENENEIYFFTQYFMKANIENKELVQITDWQSSIRNMKFYYGHSYYFGKDKLYKK
jgi:hypothetical protein